MCRSGHPKVSRRQVVGLGTRTGLASTLSLTSWWPILHRLLEA